MLRRSDISPAEVHGALRRHMLADGYPIVVDLEQSRGDFIRDAITGRDYLDFFSFYGSNPLGFAYPGMSDDEHFARLLRAARVKVSNADFYTTLLAEFVDTLSRTAAPQTHPYYFFIDGGALAVENAMKTAFDWKTRKNLAAGKGEKGSQVLHLEQAFHGRSGYTLSVTNTDPLKTQYFPKFDWPRIPCPAIRHPLHDHEQAVAEAERRAVDAAQRAFDERADDIAAILIEPIQGEGGDHHFRAEFLRELRRLADEREALLIFDEVQTGLGITGKWWAYQHFDVQPDVICFAKKMQVGGILVSPRIDEVPDNVFHLASRINSTWGGSLTDMVRCTRILECITNDELLANAAARGSELLAGLTALQGRYEGTLWNARGRGLMCAVDLSSADLRDRVLRKCFDDGVIVLRCGPQSIRFRPPLSISAEAIGDGLRRFETALATVLAGASRP
jgi:L-lysine 6-transaminase